MTPFFYIGFQNRQNLLSRTFGGDTPFVWIELTIPDYLCRFQSMNHFFHIHTLSYLFAIRKILGSQNNLDYIANRKKNPENKELANQAIKYKLWGWQKDQNIFRNLLLETLFDLLAATILFVSFTSLLNSRLKETESTFTTIFCLPMLSIWFVLLQFVYVQSPTKADICSYYAFGSIKRVLIRFCIIDKMCSNCSEFIDLMFINSWT